MGYNTKQILKDVDGLPIPQYFNPNTDTFEDSRGSNGNLNVRINDQLPAGENIIGRVKITNGTNVLTVNSDGTLPVDVQDRSARQLGQVIVTSMPEVEIKNDSGNPLPADVIDRAARLLGKITSDDGAIITVGAKADAAVTNPAASASIVALLKGLLKQLQGNGVGNTSVINKNSAGNEIFTAAYPGEISSSSLMNILSTILQQIVDTFSPITPGYIRVTDGNKTWYCKDISSPPVVGAKTVTTTAAAMFAGTSRLNNRYEMAVYNESSVPVYWGASGVTTNNGYSLLPGDSVVFRFYPAVATDIYFVSASNASVRVVELA